MSASRVDTVLVVVLAVVVGAFATQVAFDALDLPHGLFYVVWFLLGYGVFAGARALRDRPRWPDDFEPPAGHSEQEER